MGECTCRRTEGAVWLKGNEKSTVGGGKRRQRENDRKSKMERKILKG